MNIEKKQSIGAYLSNDIIKQSIENTIGDKNANAFISQVVATVNTTPALQDCEYPTIIQGALTAWVLDLPIVSSLSLAALIPFKDRRRGIKVAQFQVMVWGYVQLALRTGKVKKINATEIKEGEIRNVNHLTGDIDFEWIKENRDERETIGYAAYVELTSGFNKTIYRSDVDIKAHAKRFSETYRAGFGTWFDAYDAMAKKTVIKALVSKYCPLTSELRKAIEVDQAVITENEIYYPDNPKMTLNEKADEKHKERVERAIDEADTKEKAEALREQADEYDLNEKLNEKIKSLEKDIVVSADEAREILENKIKGSKFDYKKEE